MFFVFKFGCVFFFCTCFLEFVSVFVDCVLCLLFVRCFQCVRKKSKDLRAVVTFLRSLMLAVDIDLESYQCCFEDRRTPCSCVATKKTRLKQITPGLCVCVHFVILVSFLLSFLEVFQIASKVAVC